MTAGEWRIVRNLFEEALELEPSARAEFLASKSDGDDQIHTLVIQMLRNHDEAADFLERPLGINASAVALADESRQAAGRMIGPYRIVREIGRRFRQERRILARLDHPNIARLLDGGVTDDAGIRQPRTGVRRKHYDRQRCLLARGRALRTAHRPSALSN